jgi:hypothetical protein
MFASFCPEMHTALHKNSVESELWMLHCFPENLDQFELAHAPQAEFSTLGPDQLFFSPELVHGI